MVKLGMNLSYCDFSYYVVLLILSSSVRTLAATPIVGGTLVNTVGDVPKYPFMVSLQDRVESLNKTITYQHFCGGSLMSSSWILTAAHCVFWKNTSQIVAVIGQEDISKFQHFKYYGIKAAKYFNQYFDHSNLQHDIALLRLQQPYIAPYASILNTLQSNRQSYAKLPSDGMKAYRKKPCQIIGYGATTNGGITQSNLRIGEVEVISNNKCQEIIGRVWAPRKGENTVCALGVKQDACQGDSGGPLICSYNGQDYVYGIVSHGIACGIAGVPGIYTVTGPYFEWIGLAIRN